MKSLILWGAMLGMLLAHPALAGVPCRAPEIDASSGLAAIASVLAGLALVFERRRA